MKEPSDQRDVSAGLVNDFKKDKNSSFGQHLLTGESIVAIVAGRYRIPPFSDPLNLLACLYSKLLVSNNILK